jgi:hypothetical protein
MIWCIFVGVPRETPKTVETRQFKHFNENEFQQDLAQAFNYFTYNSDPNLAWQEWKHIDR